MIKTTQDSPEINFINYMKGKGKGNRGEKETLLNKCCGNKSTAG